MNEQMHSYRGQEMKTEGYVYAPYVPLTIIPTHVEYDESQQRYKTRARIDYDLVYTDAQRYRKDYYESHKHCPGCGSIHTTQTLMGYTLDCSDLQSYRDENRATCIQCKWSGTVHELVK